MVGGRTKNSEWENLPLTSKVRNLDGALAGLRLPAENIFYDKLICRRDLEQSSWSGGIVRPRPSRSGGLRYHKLQPRRRSDTGRRRYQVSPQPRSQWTARRCFHLRERPRDARG